MIINLFRKIVFLLIIFSLFSCSSQKNYVSEKENWYKMLSHCPCENPDLNGLKTNDGWARERLHSEMGFLQKTFAGKKDFTFFHPGATTSFRSYPYVVTYINGKKFKSGQQCAYDEKGKLIITGPAAGTPDKSSPSIGENKKGLLKINVFRVMKHVKYDSSPWKAEEWATYHKFWPPDKGINCK
ncbi:MAG: hypothetical protein HY841_14525 [Bacteroidetes bacterium]|nr:hypothetical protein [Bacteroidota bacterium]